LSLPSIFFRYFYNALGTLAPKMKSLSKSKIGECGWVSTHRSGCMASKGIEVFSTSKRSSFYSNMGQCLR